MKRNNSLREKVKLALIWLDAQHLVAKLSHSNGMGYPEITQPNNRYLHKPEVYPESPQLTLTVTGIDSLRILELMAENKGFEPIGEDPLDQLLDEESDEEFGLPEFKEHFADSLTPAVLKDWTAKDFASIYVRFRPHLERHARRYLVNPSQVEEVVQDAFLYLMTSLPELDSELGVLKFLKWKTKYLALDVIRANSRASMAPIDEQPEFASNDPEIGQDVERAEDAAIVSMALAKLQPRHREALIATLYEEKPQEVVAAQMGLSENAFRQLLFRARGAFRSALVGEAETAGLRISEILSIAARKAAKDSGKFLSATGAFLVVMALSIGLLPRFFAPNVSETELSQPSGQTQNTPAPSSQAQTEPDPAPAATEEPAVETAPAEPEIQQASTLTPAPEQEAQTATPVFTTAVFSIKDTYGELLSSARIAELNAKPLLSQLNSTNIGDNRVYTLANGSGLAALVDIDSLNPDAIHFSRVDINVGGISVVAIPRASGSSVTRYDGLTTYFIGLSDFVLASNSAKSGNFVWDNTGLGKAKVRIVLTVDEVGHAVSASIDISSN